MTQQEHDDTMKKLREEFEPFARELAKLDLFARDEIKLENLLWRAFTNGKIPKVDA